MIPKIIHYVWVGNAPKSDLILKCIASWKKYCPDYEIKEWGNDVLSEIDNQYVREAYEAKKWAFVSDYIRLYVLQKYGGVYLDTDVEIRKSLDVFLQHDFFIGSELCHGSKTIGTAVIGANKENPIIKEMLDLYRDIHFVKKSKNWELLPDNEKYDMTANTIRLVPVLINQGIKSVYTETESIKINSTSFIYPVNYFCLDTDKSYAVHHFDASWISDFKFKNKLILPWFGNTKIILRKYKQQKSNAKFELHTKEKIILKISTSNKDFWCLVKVGED